MAQGEGGGPKPIVIDWGLVERLCEIHCTGEEIASALKINYETLSIYIKNEFGLSFPQYFDQKKVEGKISLRRRQYKAAIDDGNTTMMIWLGKQWLGQKEISVVENVGKDGGPIVTKNMTEERFREIAKEQDDAI